MADIVNLRSARKAKARAAAEREAEQNRARFGRSKAEKQASALERKRSEGVLDGAKREQD